MSEAKPTDPSSGDWGPCPPGELRNLASRLKSRRGMPVVLQFALVVVLGVGLGFGAYVFWPPGEITCAQCNQYIAGWQRGDVPSQHTQTLVKEHVAHCRGCHDKHHEALERLLARLPLLVPGWTVVALADHLWPGHPEPGEARLVE